jgi:heme/copper-type cytochrome/quinol oxidase subunit 2
VEILILLAVFGLATLPVIAFRAFRKNKPKKSKEERFAESVIAIIVILIITLFVFLKQSVFNDRKEDILRESNTSQSAQ